MVLYFPRSRLQPHCDIFCTSTINSHPGSLQPSIIQHFAAFVMKSSPTLPQELPLTSQYLRSLAHHPFTIRTFRHLLRFSFPFLSPLYPHSEQDFWALSSPRPFVGTLSPSRLSMTTSLSSLHLPLLMFSTVFIPRNNLHVISSTGP